MLKLKTASTTIQQELLHHTSIAIDIGFPDKVLTDNRLMVRTNHSQIYWAGGTVSSKRFSHAGSDIGKGNASPDTKWGEIGTESFWEILRY